MIHSCTVHGHQLLGYRWPGLLSRTAFCRPCKAQLVHYGTKRPTQGSTNQNWLCAKLLPMAVSIYPVVCVHSCRLLGTQHYCLCSNGSFCPPGACHPPPPHPTPPPINAIRDITGPVKKLSQKPALNTARQSYL